MISARKLLREAFVKYVTDAETVLGDRVYTDRVVTDHFDSALAQALIMTASEEVEVFENSPRKYKRTCNLKLEAVVPRPSKNVNVANVASDLADNIEFAINTALECGLPGTPDSLMLVGKDTGLRSVTEEIRELDSSRPLASIEMTWEVTYLAEAQADGSDISKLSSVHTSAELEGSVERETKTELCL